MNAPRPNNAPTTLAALYENETGEKAGENEIRAILESLPGRRKKVVSLYLKGYSYRQIACAFSRGRESPIKAATIQSVVRFAMRKVYRRLTGDKTRWLRITQGKGK
jgi:DNA-directed RNA polymerase specialized sigma24 family protein